MPIHEYGDGLFIIISVGCIECGEPTSVLEAGPRSEVELAYEKILKGHGMREYDHETAARCSEGNPWGQTVVRRAAHHSTALELHRVPIVEVTG